MTKLKYLDFKHLQLANFVLFYYGVFLFFHFNQTLFFQFQSKYISHNRDIFELGLIALGLPNYLILHPVFFPVLDAVILLFPIVLLGYYYLKGRFSVTLGILFAISLYIYFLLHSILVYTCLQAYTCYLLLSCLFFLNNKEPFQFVLKIVRWMFLYSLGSAGIWKIFRGAVFEPNEFSNILIGQHAEYLRDNCTQFMCRIYFILIEFPLLSYALYLVATVIELSFLIGFFTRRYDKWLVLLAFVFVFFDQQVMRIAYWTMLISVIPLWFSSYLYPPASEFEKQNEV